jgi:flavin reductase (DIM6/NTAB) family NADH-FMN oxidoreductase RutF
MTAGRPVPTGRDGGGGPDRFPRFARAISQSMFIVTAAVGGVRDGCLIGFATQASIHPPRLLVCLSVKNATFRTALRATHLGVHLVPPDRFDLAELFGGETGDEVDKFSRCRWEPGPGDVPLLPECPTRCAGLILGRHPFGDHVGFLLEPVAVWAADAVDSLDTRQAAGIDPGHAP